MTGSGLKCVHFVRITRFHAECPFKHKIMIGALTVAMPGYDLARCKCKQPYPDIGSLGHRFTILDFWR